MLLRVFSYFYLMFQDMSPSWSEALQQKVWMEYTVFQRALTSSLPLLFDQRLASGATRCPDTHIPPYVACPTLSSFTSFAFDCAVTLLVGVQRA